VPVARHGACWREDFIAGLVFDVGYDIAGVVPVRGGDAVVEAGGEDSVAGVEEEDGDEEGGDEETALDDGADDPTGSHGWFEVA